jgi:D-galactarolactone cycloisomerase
MAALPPDPPRRDPVEPILEFDRTSNPFRQAVLARPIEHEGGVVAIPDAPGLGIEINRNALVQYALKEA